MQTILVMEVYLSTLISLSDAKARLSEVVRSVRTRGEDAVITVDGEPAVRLVPVHSGPRPLTPAEAAGFRALLDGLTRIVRPAPEFDAVELVSEGRK
ncbi:MAG: type II toxin-antitoxin system Phd/YefM family antitoxin [Myxococcales bacterium]|nr:type II toxin-antitoxin system Phd/YefM family antitoxin [Myxococcales bacterium]